MFLTGITAKRMYNKLVIPSHTERNLTVFCRSRCQRSLEALQELCRSPFQERALCHLAAFLIGKKRGSQRRRCTSSLQVVRQNLYLFNGRYRNLYGGLTFQSDRRSCMGCLATISQQNSGQSAEFQGHSGRVSSFRTHDRWRVFGVENAIDMSQIQLVKHEDFTFFLCLHY